MFWMRNEENEENSFPIRTLIWRPAEYRLFDIGDPDQLTSEESNCSGSRLLSMKPTNTL